MAFFSNEIAATLQYFTFPLEVIGLTLATIEVRFPETTKRIGKWIEISSAKLARALALGAGNEASRARQNRTDRYMFLGLIGYGVSFIIILFLPDFPFKPTIVSSLVVIFLIFILFSLISWAAWIAKGVTDFALKFEKGRAVGTLGIILAGIGVLGEAYQFTTQLVV